MAAIITTKFRVLNAENFARDIADDANSVYIGIGKTDPWSNQVSATIDSAPFIPNDHQDDMSEASQNCFAMIRLKAGDVATVVPRFNWVSSNVYSAWDSADSNIFDDNVKFYVLTNEFKAYKCISSTGQASTSQPVTIGTDPFTLGDGYVWKYMYTLTAGDSEKFLTNAYMPVKTLQVTEILEDTDVNYAQQQSQITSAASLTLRGIERYVVTAGGDGYTTAPEVTITGDGSGATATAVIEDGSNTVTEVVMVTQGTGYSVADVVISGGGGADATVRAVLTPDAGHGVDPVRELGGFYVSLNTQLEGVAGGDFTVGNDFRQVTLIKNPYNFGTTEVASSTTLRTTKGLHFTSGDETQYSPDDVIEGSISLAKAFIVQIDTANHIVYYNQNAKTGYGVFVEGENVTYSSGPSGTSEVLVSINSQIDTEVENNSGQTIFLENRDPINRSVTQIEDIKLIIEM
jgi:hypothetical protein